MVREKMLHFVNTITFIFGSVSCAPVIVDFRLPAEKDNSFDYDDHLVASNAALRVEDLDPRNQAVGSSYTVIATKTGSGAINKVAYTREYEPHGENSEYRGTRFNFENDDGSSSSSQEFPYSRDTADTFFSRGRRPSKFTFEKYKRKNEPSNKRSHDVETLPLRNAGSAQEEVGDVSQPSRHYHSKLGEDDESYEEGYDKEKHFDKEAGKKFIEAEKAVIGEKDRKEYHGEEGFDKGEEEKYGKEVKKAAVSEKEAAKKSHTDEEQHYGEEYRGAEGERGVSSKKKGGHKKGHKKNGFHKVHHKDEYKNDEVFYDDEHDLKEHDEHAHEHEKHDKERGGAAKKTHLDSAYHEGYGAKKASQDKGHHFEDASAHKKEAGREHRHDENFKYGKKGGVKEAEKHSHAEKGGHGGGYSDHGFGF